MTKNTCFICFAIAICTILIACKKTYNCTLKNECTTVRGTIVLVDNSPVPPTTVASKFTGATFCITNYNSRDAYNAAINNEHQNWQNRAVVGANTFQTITVNFKDTTVYSNTIINSKVSKTDKPTFENLGYTCNMN